MIKHKGEKMIKHFVVFFSPGTLFAEATEKPIDSWDVEEAKKKAINIKERHGATPYGFCFTTRERKNDELDSKEIKRSGTYFLGGKVLTIKDIKKRKDPKDAILISNMECNHWNKVVENCNSWKIVQPFLKGDTLLSDNWRKI
jgi:hypothetical protein